MNTRRRYGRWALVIGLMALVLAWWALRGVDRAEPVLHGPPSSTASLAPPAPPRQLSADLRPSEEIPPRVLVVEVVDILGGAVEGSIVQFNGRDVGLTDEHGLLTVDAARSALPRTGVLDVRCDGYADARKLTAVPGRVRVPLVPEATIAGVVVARGTSEPIGGIHVGSGPRSAVADAQGAFQFRGVPPGTHILRAQGKGYVGETPEPVVVGLGTTREGVRIVVDPSLTIDGRVHGGGHPPQVPLYVSAAKEPARPGMGETTTVDDDGRFTFVGVTPGSYKLTVFPADAVATDQFSPLLLAPTTVTVDEADVEVEIDIGTLHTLLVEVVDARDEPVPGVRVQFTQSDESRLVGAYRDTDAFGRVWLDGLIPGAVKRIRPAISGVEAVDVTVPTDEVVRFTVPARASVFGRLQTEEGAEPSSRLLVLRAEGADGPAGWTQSDLHGAFRLDGLSAGAYDLEIHANGGELSVVMGLGTSAPEFTAPVTLRSGETAGELVITLPVRKGALRGRVVDALGGGVSAAVVTHALDRDQPPPHEAGVGDAVTTTDLDGAFRFPDVELGPNLVITAWTPGGAFATRRGISAGPESVELVVDEPIE